MKPSSKRRRTAGCPKNAFNNLYSESHAPKPSSKILFLSISIGSKLCQTKWKDSTASSTTFTEAQLSEEMRGSPAGRFHPVRPDRADRLPHTQRQRVCDRARRQRAHDRSDRGAGCRG